MELGNWNDKYSVNNAIIDDQHKRLLHILYRMERLSKKGSNRNELLRLLGEMTDYADQHFKSEERYMERLKYPKYEEHRELHSNYSLTVGRFISNQSSDNPDKLEDILRFLTKWWENHILVADKAYAEFHDREFHQLIPKH